MTRDTRHVSRLRVSTPHVRHVTSPLVPGCPRCGLPLCGPACPMEAKHRGLECGVFQRARASFNFR